MRAIIIAAGKGTRLYPLTKNTPKSLLEIGDGLTLLESQLHSLKENNIKDITIIVGYLALQIEAKIDKYRDDFNIDIVYNPFYDISNNLISVWMARYYMNEDFITINGDDIFNPIIIEDLLKSPEQITMVVDFKENYDEDDMKIVHNRGLIKKVSKQIPIHEANGESVGIIKFSGRGRKIYIDTLESMVRYKENINLFYLSAIQRIIDNGYPVHMSKCSAKHWGELDFHPDLLFIREYVKQENLAKVILDSQEK